MDPEYHYEAVNVENQQHNPHSLLWWTKRLLALRKRWPAFGLGTIEFLQPDNRKILAFVRRYEQECLLVVCNLSRFVQAVELNLSAFQQMVPVEMFGRNAFPPITDKPYLFTLGPHAFYWFSLTPRFAETARSRLARPAPGGDGAASFEVDEHWEELLEERMRWPSGNNVFRAYIQPRRWFGGKTREVKSVQHHRNHSPCRPKRANPCCCFVDCGLCAGRSRTLPDAARLCHR